MYKEQVLKLLEAISNDNRIAIQEICDELNTRAKVTEIEIKDQMFCSNILQEIVPTKMKLVWR